MYIINYAETVPNTTIRLGATNKEDIFTVSSEIGNGALTYPVGLITSDEVVMAGGRAFIDNSDTGENRNYFLHSGTVYWTFSPNGFRSDSIAIIIHVHSIGRFGSAPVTTSNGVRPVISLQPSTTYIKGSGTQEIPYII